ncbi:MAG TPA: hypothetical protein PLV70_08165 [Flavobacteriales bacterium]|nr:hypothetical protein [Flavobacteriales bacterium]HRN35719.1 hypothetical protein [Flavobacteriales bacterium]HRO40150.1 hypothetical protein [Flavobacteriales bacterium]HRP81565.1 hypothetical protein [Flavobacteriales bacterium]HRQ85068.1 hypothetical protein [Flavobacteriales bacterium]
MRYFALMMSVAYAVVGAMILFNASFLPQITRFRVPLGVVLLGYGALRAFMWQRKDALSRRQSD